MVNPGGSWTEQVAAMKPRMMPPMMCLWWPVIRLVQRRRSPTQARQPVIRAATNPLLAGQTGLWITEKNKIGESSETARDDGLSATVYQRMAILADVVWSA